MENVIYEFQYSKNYRGVSDKNLKPKLYRKKITRKWILFEM